MTRKIKTWRNPYDNGFSPTRPKEIELEEGLTVLVGCNGAGKTTLVNNICSELKSLDIPYHKFDNLHDGGSNSWGKMFCMGNYEDGIGLWSSSEGEQIKSNIGLQSRLYKDFLESGIYKDKSYKIHRVFSENKRDSIETTERWLLFDACDSGMSIDAVVEIKSLFRTMLEDSLTMGINLFIIIVANEYELVRHEKCFDVNTGKYLTFKDYEDYRRFILKSRQRKEKRIERQKIYFQKEKEREILEKQKRTDKVQHKIDAIKRKAIEENRELTHSERYRIQDYEMYIKNG